MSIITTVFEAKRGDTAIIPFYGIIPEGATTRIHLRQTPESATYFVLTLEEASIIISSTISEVCEGTYYLDVECTADGITTTLQQTTVIFSGDITRTFGSEAEIAPMLRGAYRYYEQVLEVDTAGDWRTYADNTGFYTEYCTVGNAVKGAGTWVAKFKIEV